MRLRLVDSISLAAILCLCVLAAWLYADLPERIPVHWGPAGSPDSFANKLVGVAIFLVLPIATFAIIRFFPLIAPAGFRMEQSRHIVAVVNMAVAVMIVLISATALISAGDQVLRMHSVMPVLTGALFIVLGNYMGKLERNWIIGIRTPWSLASEEVWAGTHRFGRWIFVAAGLLLLATPWMPWPPIAYTLAIIVVTAIVTVAQSFVLYVRIHGISGP